MAVRAGAASTEEDEVTVVSGVRWMMDGTDGVDACDGWNVVPGRDSAGVDGAGVASKTIDAALTRAGYEISASCPAGDGCGAAQASPRAGASWPLTPHPPLPSPSHPPGEGAPPTGAGRGLGAGGMAVRAGAASTEEDEVTVVSGVRWMMDGADGVDACDGWNVVPGRDGAGVDGAGVASKTIDAALTRAGCEISASCPAGFPWPGEGSSLAGCATGEAFNGAGCEISEAYPAGDGCGAAQALSRAGASWPLTPHPPLPSPSHPPGEGAPPTGAGRGLGAGGMAVRAGAASTEEDEVTVVSDVRWMMDGADGVDACDGWNVVPGRDGAGVDGAGVASKTIDAALTRAGCEISEAYPAGDGCGAAQASSRAGASWPLTPHPPLPSPSHPPGEGAPPTGAGRGLGAGGMAVRAGAASTEEDEVTVVSGVRWMMDGADGVDACDGWNVVSGRDGAGVASKTIDAALTRVGCEISASCPAGLPWPDEGNSLVGCAIGEALTRAGCEISASRPAGDGCGAAQALSRAGASWPLTPHPPLPSPSHPPGEGAPPTGAGRGLGAGGMAVRAGAASTEEDEVTVVSDVRWMTDAADGAVGAGVAPKAAGRGLSGAECEISAVYPAGDERRGGASAPGVETPGFTPALPLGASFSPSTRVGTATLS